MCDNNINDKKASTSQSESLPFGVSFEQEDKVDNVGKIQKSEIDAGLIKNTKSIPAVAEASSGKCDPFYNMNHKYRGKAYIFNHEKFDHGLPQRTDTHIDSENLTTVLDDLGFDVVTYDDRTYSQLSDIINDLAHMDHEESDCVLIAVMTHGEYGLLYAKDTYYAPETLWSPFTADKCPSIAGKPKMFFIQACQRAMYDEIPYTLPVQADFLIVQSTIPGYYSWREPGYGSWFIQTLCEELQGCGKEQDLLQLLTFVNQKIATYETYNPFNLSIHRQKQIPSVNSTLTRLLVFGEKLKQMM